MRSGLELVVKELEAMWGLTIETSPAMRVYGAVEFAGSSRPFESSAVKLTVCDTSVFIPCPVIPPQESDAAIFLHSGQKMVLPLIRLFNETKPDSTIEYLTLDQWLLDALTVWKFRDVKRLKGQTDGKADNTIYQRLRDSQLPVPQQLRIVASLIRYALFGVDFSNRYLLSKLAGVILPVRGQWLRTYANGKLAEACAQRQLITARLQQAGSGELVPSVSVYANRYRIMPTSLNDFGVDPVHTPENEGIRMIGRLGTGVGIQHRKLVVPDSVNIPLSFSTGQIPFAGHNDPRRLLMAANMQVQATDLVSPESPLVRNEFSMKSLCPPGVNLRTAYMAWKGLNHEDAWVVSESAAAKLNCLQHWVQTIAIPTIEAPVEILIAEGTKVQRGQRLVVRRICPAMLSASLEVWKDISSFEDIVMLDPVSEELADESGNVTAVEVLDFLENDKCKEYLVPLELTGRYRQLVRITFSRFVPLSVGDKLANRHGHKGIVGAILPDNEMPRHNGLPLEALIDPISVMNRSNWGQVFETVLGNSDDPEMKTVVGFSATETQKEFVRRNGQQIVSTPVSSNWLAREVSATVGKQFLMRLPHIASEKLSLAANGFGNGKRPQRFGEMDSWALWAHGGFDRATVDTLKVNRAASQFMRLLFAAGYYARMEGRYLKIDRLQLDEDLPNFVERRSVGKSKLSESIAEIVDFNSEAMSAVVIEPPLADVRIRPRNVNSNGHIDEKGEMITIAWLPLLPYRDRLPRKSYSGLSDDHDLTVALRNIARLAFYRRTGRTVPTKRDTPLDIEQTLRLAIENYFELAYGHAVGLQAIGDLSCKRSFLRRKLMGHTIRPSIRATAAPAGDFGLSVDEVGVNLEMARVLLNDRHASEELVRESLASRTFWIKRDPILHRFGLLQVRAKLTHGDVIRLPASMIGPLGADYDGDTVAMFANLDGQPSNLFGCCPSSLAYDELLERAMFVPSKQYRFGLGLLMQDPLRLAALQEELLANQSPMLYVDPDSPAKTMDVWTQQAHLHGFNDHAWTVIERHSIDALATNPGMDLAYHSGESLQSLSMVRWAAAKRDIFDPSSSKSWDALCRILSGDSLCIYLHSAVKAPDPIRDVMIAAKESVGKFGGALRRLLYSLLELNPNVVRLAQALTEQATQRALSVKAGKKPLEFLSFNRHLKALMSGTPLKLTGTKDDEDVDEFFKGLSLIYEQLRHAICTKSKNLESVAYLDWLRSSHRLSQITNAGCILIPISDLRIQAWFSPSVYEGTE